MTTVRAFCAAFNTPECVSPEWKPHTSSAFGQAQFAENGTSAQIGWRVICAFIEGWYRRRLNKISHQRLDRIDDSRQSTVFGFLSPYVDRYCRHAAVLLK
jgi:hypothetical protein